jgi:hypothetical protein
MARYYIEIAWDLKLFFKVVVLRVNLADSTSRFYHLMSVLSKFVVENFVALKCKNCIMRNIELVPLGESMCGTVKCYDGAADFIKQGSIFPSVRRYSNHEQLGYRFIAWVARCVRFHLWKEMFAFGVFNETAEYRST